MSRGSGGSISVAGYGARLSRPAPKAGGAVRVRSAAELLIRTIALLHERAPSITADAAVELGSVVLGLRFGDGSRATLQSDHNRLVATRGGREASVQCRFDDEALERLFDLEQKPAEVLEAGRFDVRGRSVAVLAAWRVFRLLSQRASGLRVVQSLWTAYREQRGLPRAAAPKSGAARGPVRLALPDAAALLRGTTATALRSASVPETRILWDGRKGAGWWTFPGPKDADLFEVMEACRLRTAEEITRLIPEREPRASLYDLMRDYPDRGGKGLRPALCMASCGAFGGRSTDALRTSAAIEMFHNAFLIHDDIEDESRFRRGASCLHVAQGVPLAINAGDGLNLEALNVVLGNIDGLGLARTLALITEIIHMCRETIEGQAIELAWIRNVEVPTADEDYLHMVVKKTGWYTCISPTRLGAIAAGHLGAGELDRLAEVFLPVGVAFQIQDDILNLVGDEARYGKESLGDLMEGKRTLMLIHLARILRASERKKVMSWLALPRGDKREADSRWLLGLMERHGSIDHGRKVAAHFASRGAALFEERLSFLPESEPKAVLRQVIHYANTRSL